MIELVQTADPDLIERLVNLEINSFGEGGLNKWHLIPLIRHGRVFIIREDREIAGLVEYMLDWEDPRKAYMVGVSTDKRWRGQGIGTRILKESFAWLQGEGIKEIELTVAPNNIAAVTIYEKKLGFQIVELRTDEFGQGENRLIMKLSLADFSDSSSIL